MFRRADFKLGHSELEVSSYVPLSGEEKSNESIEVFGSANYVRFRTGRGGHTFGGVSRKAGNSDAIFYNWRKKYVGMMPSEIRRLAQLGDENVKLKRIVADLPLDKA